MLYTEQNAHTGFVIHSGSTTMVRGPKWKPLEFHSAFTKIVNQRWWFIPGGAIENNITINDLREAGQWYLTHPHLSYQSGLCRSHLDLGEWLHFKLNWVVTSIAMAVPDVLCLLAQINTSAEVGILILQMLFSSHQFVRTPRSCLFLPCTSTSMSYMSCLRTISVLFLCSMIQHREILIILTFSEM